MRSMPWSTVLKALEKAIKTPSVNSFFSMDSFIFFVNTPFPNSIKTLHHRALPRLKNPKEQLGHLLMFVIKIFNSITSLKNNIISLFNHLNFEKWDGKWGKSGKKHTLLYNCQYKFTIKYNTINTLTRIWLKYFA